MSYQRKLADEFVRLVCTYYPDAEPTLERCYVKLLDLELERLKRRLYYIGIYHPQEVAAELENHRQALHDIAENLGLIAVVFMDASRIIRDPVSRLKHENPRLWLELYWVATHY